MPSVRAPSFLRRGLRRLAMVPSIEQAIRRAALARAARRHPATAPDALVTSSGRRTVVRSELPAPGTRSFARLVRSAGRSRVLTVRPRSITGSTTDALTELASRGIPIWVDAALPDDVRSESALWATLSTPPAPDGTDLDRYVRSVRLARHASPPRKLDHVSVLLATRRPDMLDHAVESIVRQLDVEIQLVVGLHGTWPSATEERIAALWAGDLVTIRADTDTSLGGLLRQMTERADGTLLTKWDDDDWYGPHHVGDLARALATSGAHIVGKAAEFVWLEAIGETIRRPALGARTYSANLAGGTLMMSRSELEAAGGFPDLPRSVDRVLIDAIRDRGGSVYRTHGLEFVLRRSSAGEHTWSADANYFLDDAIERRPGLDLTFADIHRPDASSPDGAP